MGLPAACHAAVIHAAGEEGVCVRAGGGGVVCTICTAAFCSFYAAACGPSVAWVTTTGSMHACMSVPPIQSNPIVWHVSHPPSPLQRMSPRGLRGRRVGGRCSTRRSTASRLEGPTAYKQDKQKSKGGKKG